MANIYGVYDAIDGVFGLEAAKDMNEQTPTETLEQAMWHLFVHTAHDVYEQDIETVLRTQPELFDKAAGIVLRAIYLQMLAAEHRRPDRNHSNEQREADERRCFAGNCAKDGVAGMDGAEPPEPGGDWPGVQHLRAAMDYATTPAQAAAAGKADSPVEARWPRPSLGKAEIA